MPTQTSVSGTTSPRKPPPRRCSVQKPVVNLVHRLARLPRVDFNQPLEQDRTDFLRLRTQAVKSDGEVYELRCGGRSAGPDVSKFCSPSPDETFGHAFIARLHSLVAPVIHACT